MQSLKIDMHTYLISFSLLQNSCVIINWIISLFQAHSEPSSSVITADSVKNYLDEHPEFLDSYIQQNIHPTTIEQWISKKPQKTSPSTRPSSSTSMPIVSSPNNNISAATRKSSGKPLDVFDHQNITFVYFVSRY